MLTLNLGPLALGLAHLCLLTSLLLASLVGAWLGRKRGGNPEAQLFLLFLLALLGARLAFVLEYASLYEGRELSMTGKGCWNLPEWWPRCHPNASVYSS